MNRRSRLLMALTVGACATTSAAAPARNGSARASLEEVVVTSTPLAGFEISAHQVPGNIQQASASEIESIRSAGLAQMLNRRMGSIFINEAQNNPLQPDVQFRGFVASPLLGQSQGMAVYQDGVRINDPFGDIMSWALVPEAAISRIELIPGSNPVFGLNTLGGALSIHTKNGFTDPGTRAELMGGSFGRVIGEVQSGGRFGTGHNLSYFGSARYFDEDGWRDQSPSQAVHVFGSLDWRTGDSELGLNVTSVTTELIGNGPAPVQLLEEDRDAIYTSPDETENSLLFVNLNGSHEFTPTVRLDGVAYFRRSNIDSLNGDESNFEECDDDPGLMCDEEDEEIVLGADGEPIEASEDLEGATVNRSHTDQGTAGLTLQLGFSGPLWGRANRLVIGGSVDRSNVDFDSSSELGALDGTRRAIGGGVFVGESFVDLDTRLANASFFFTDTLSVTPDLHITLAGRYNDSSIELRDRLGTDLNGDHSYHRFNGAAGVTWRATSAFQLYASYSESNRVPSPVELTCADEADPCALPNAFLSDPPLEQIVATTSEIGARGSLDAFNWHLGAFRTVSEDDILFISAGALTNRGFFDNVGETRRQGIELNLDGTLGKRVSWFAHYTWLEAQFREGLTVASPNNPEAVDGEIDVVSGSRIPGIPENMLKAGIRFDPVSNFSVTLDGVYQSDQYFRGDEANLTEPLSGFAVVNATGEWRLSPHLTVFAQIENLFDAEYETFGLFGAPDEVLGDDYDDPRFVSPAAPLSAWVGFRLTL